MRKNRWLLGVLLLVFLVNCTQNETHVYKSIKIKNIGELRGNIIGIYIFEELPEYGNIKTLNVAVQYKIFEKGNNLTFDLVVPIANVLNWNNKKNKSSDMWFGEGDYYIAIVNMFDIINYSPRITDAYIFMNKKNMPAKISIRKADTILDFRNFNKGSKYYHEPYTHIFKDDLNHENDLVYEDYYYKRDKLMDVLYYGTFRDMPTLNKPIEPNMLKYFNQNELRLLRNMIFAKNNYIFKSKDLRDYFSMFSWYEGTDRFVHNKMTITDWQNIAIIQDFEYEMTRNSINGSFIENTPGITITGYHGPPKELLNIPETINGIKVTKIGNRAFHEKQLISVIIPNSVIIIDDNAFSECQLASVTIGNGVTTIGDYAFAFNHLTNVDIPNSVTTIGRGAFRHNRKIKNINIGNSVCYIGNRAFSQNQLSSVVIPDSVTTIDTGVFSENRLTYAIIGNSVTTIGIGSFSHNQLTSVIIPNGVTLIASDAFYSNQLISVTIPDSVTKIASRAFDFNPLLNITIGNNNTAIDKYSFHNNFSDFYNSQDKKAGTYIWSANGWTVK